jgi:chromosome segregation and condensation protein ScpB
VRQLTKPRRHPGLTPDQAEVLAIAIAGGMATRSHIEDIRGLSQSRVSPERVTMIPGDCSETLALLISGELLAAKRDDNAQGRPNVYRPTPQLLQAFGVQTLEELCERMGITQPPSRGAEIGVTCPLAPDVTSCASVPSCHDGLAQADR